MCFRGYAHSILTPFCLFAFFAVTSLPGWYQALPSDNYSGYVPVGKNAQGGPTGQLHYWFTESENNPSTDPVVLWLNGGPGSSSLIGLLTENGQFQLSNLSLKNMKNGVPNLYYNTMGWTQVANMLYIEQPKGVGFSFCTDITNCVNNDQTTAEETYDALIQFFTQKFPEYAQNEFYITGESYAGIYIPMLMDQIDKKGGINLRGAAIGDGCIGNGPNVSSCGGGPAADNINVEFFAGHGFYPQPLYQQIKANCGNYQNQSPLCESLLLQMTSDLGTFDIYNIYDDCGSDTLVTLEELTAYRRATTHKSTFETSMYADPLTARKHLQRLEKLKKNQNNINSTIHADSAVNDYPCGAETVQTQWLALKSVQQALHVKNIGFGQQYTETVQDLRPLYKYLASKYRMTIYSGDVDACVPYYGSETWTRELGYPVVEDWHVWTAGSSSGQTNIKAGYVINYASNFTFITINGAGHMVS